MTTNAYEPLGRPMMTDEELAFLDQHIKPGDTVFEWGSGASTLWLAQRCAWITTVEHQKYAAQLVTLLAPRNVSVVYAPPDHHYQEGTKDDGEPEVFRRYTKVYVGESVDAVIIDGRARVSCARQVAETAFIGPHPGLKVFVHDCAREDYQRIWTDGEWGKRFFDPVVRVGDLMLLKMRED